jgi:hypothetical protein
LAPGARFELATLRLTAEQPTSSELAGVGPNRRQSASCDETGRITFSFFFHLSSAFSRRPPPLVLRIYDSPIQAELPPSPRSLFTVPPILRTAQPKQCAATCRKPKSTSSMRDTSRWKPPPFARCVVSQAVPICAVVDSSQRPGAYFSAVSALARSALGSRRRFPLRKSSVSGNAM